MNSWYLIQFKRNSHYVAEQNLRRQGFKTFLPLQEFTTNNHSKFLTITRPLFPGYMFVSDELNKTPWYKINNTRGVSRIICQNGVPKKVPPHVVSSLMSRCDGLGKLLPPKALERGDSVAILSGALANFIATVESIDSDRRIWVLLELMGQIARVQVVSEQIKLLN